MENKNNYYKKWVGVLLSFFLPGLGQFLSGQKMHGIYWHCGLIVFFLIFQTSLLFQFIDWKYFALFLLCIYIILVFIMLFDSYRPIKRFSLSKWFILILIAIFIIATENYLFTISDSYKFSTGCMEPTLHSLEYKNKLLQDRVVADSISYKFRNPHRGEIVICKPEGIIGISNNYVKRIVGLPGETISIKPPYIYINGKRLESPSIFKEISECKNGYNGYCLPINHIEHATLKNEADEIQLKEDEYFVLGDNSTKSFDSRYFGPIKRNSIISRATAIIWPPSRIRYLK